jgi:hypothetical protein
MLAEEIRGWVSSFSNPKAMSKLPQWLIDAGKYAEVISRMLEKLEVDNARNLERRVYKLIEDLEKEKAKVSEYVALTKTNDHGEAKQRVRSLMNKMTSPKTLIAEKYNLDTSFLQGIGEYWDKTGEGRDKFKVLESMEKKIDHQRRLVSEAYSFALELAESAAIEEGYDSERVLIVLSDLHEEMKKDFHEMDAIKFWQEYKGSFQKLTLETDKKEPEVSLAKAKYLCEKYYPVLLVSEAFADEGRLGNIYSHRLGRWEEKVSNAYKESKEERERQLRVIAADVMGIAIYRNAYGPDSGWPDVQETTRVAHLVALPEDQSQESTVEINDSTQVSDLVSELLNNAIPV